MGIVLLCERCENGKCDLKTTFASGNNSILMKRFCVLVPFLPQTARLRRRIAESNQSALLADWWPFHGITTTFPNEGEGTLSLLDRCSSLHVCIFLGKCVSALKAHPKASVLFLSLKGNDQDASSHFRQHFRRPPSQCAFE